MRTTLPLMLALLLTACGGAQEPKASSTERPGGFVPPRTQAPEPLPGQAHSSPITAYVGKYPGDTLGGVTFFDRTEIANALISAVGDEELRRMITAHGGVMAPVFMTGRRIAAHGCEQHRCAEHNWTFLVSPDGSEAEACFHDYAAMGASSRWYANDTPVKRPGGCPAA